jgi:hypothetical protein
LTQDQPLQDLPLRDKRAAHCCPDKQAAQCCRDNQAWVPVDTGVPADIVDCLAIGDTTASAAGSAGRDIAHHSSDLAVASSAAPARNAAAQIEAHYCAAARAPTLWADK